jgi:hypothetical protein
MEYQLKHTVEILQQTPSTLRSFLGGLSDVWTRAAGDRDDWTPHQVMIHLIHGEESDWIPRTRIILEYGETRPFTPFDRTAGFKESDKQAISELLDKFESLRGDNIRALEQMKLQPHQFDLTGQHPEFGPVTLRELLSTWAVHDLGHIRQIVRAMAARYSEDVGPFARYLSILDQ